MSSSQFRRGKRRFDDDESTFVKRDRHRRRLPPGDCGSETLGLPEGDRWSTWDQSAPTERGPQPHPDWLVTDLAAVDTELGILKTGKEADVFLLRRGVPGTDRSCLLAAKRYRAAEHRMFQRDSEYLEGRRVRESRVNRAIAARSAAGRAMISTQWASAEFAALNQLCAAGLPVPYPVQILQTELLLEFIGEADGTAAPRLAEIRPAEAELASLWDQLVTALCGLAQLGYAHGDLSAYNLLVHGGRLVMIDMPQVVDVIANPRGAEFLTRDSANVARWFTARRLTGVTPAPADLAGLLLAEARLSLQFPATGRGITPAALPLGPAHDPRAEKPADDASTESPIRAQHALPDRRQDHRAYRRLSSGKLPVAAGYKCPCSQGAVGGQRSRWTRPPASPLAAPGAGAVRPARSAPRSA